MEPLNTLRLHCLKKFASWNEIGPDISIKEFVFYDQLESVFVSGVPRMTHSSDYFAVGLYMRNARVICRGKLLPPRALHMPRIVNTHVYF
jgi:hypothetical protein